MTIVMKMTEAEANHMLNILVSHMNVAFKNMSESMDEDAQSFWSKSYEMTQDLINKLPVGEVSEF